MQIFVEWLKSNTWVADWVASLVAVIALVGPAIAKAQRVKMDPKSLEVLRQGSAVLWAVMSLVLSKTALLIAVVIELLGLVTKLLLGASPTACIFISAPSRC